MKSYVSLRGVKKLTGFGHSFLYKLRKSGRLSMIRVNRGTGWYVAEDDLLVFAYNWRNAGVDIEWANILIKIYTARNGNRTVLEIVRNRVLG